MAISTPSTLWKLLCEFTYENPTGFRSSGVLLGTGGDLLFRAVSSQVPSALKGLTSVFGMRTGGAPSPLPPVGVSGAVASGLRLQLLHTLTTAQLPNEISHCPQLTPLCFSAALAASSYWSLDSKSSPRPISNGKLHTLLHLHRRPISW